METCILRQLTAVGSGGDDGCKAPRLKGAESYLQTHSAVDTSRGI